MQDLKEKGTPSDISELKGMAVKMNQMIRDFYAEQVREENRR